MIKNEDCSPGLCYRIAGSAGARLRQSLPGPNSTASNREAHAFAADATSTGPTVDGDCAGTAGAPDRVPLELGVYGLFCLLNILELALVPTTFLNLGLIEVVEDFVERQSRAEDTPYAIDAPK